MKGSCSPERRGEDARRAVVHNDAHIDDGMVHRANDAAWCDDGAVFEAFVEQCLEPELGPGDVVVLDKLAAHKTTRVRELVEATGARPIHLPGYSPDFNPIEHA